MRKSILILSALALSAGIASADRGGARGGDHRGPVVQSHNSGGGGHWNGGNRGGTVNGGNRGGSWNGNHSSGWQGGVTVTPRHDRGWENRRPVVVNSGSRWHSSYVQRRPIYVQRPTIRYRYYNYYQRPQILVENYAPMTGYIWVAGAWNWDGSEWLWTPGHYEPDPTYNDYDSSYDSGYYDGY